MQPLSVLLTNFELDVRGGSQLYVRDVALGLLRRGHTPVVYSPVLGAAAWDLRTATVPVVDDLDRISSAPDVIHGHHNHELFTALLRFPGVPALRVCHGWLDERPQPFPRVLRYIAVDDTTRHRCLHEWGVPEDRLEVLLNFVDLDRFAARGPLPVRPARALVFSNSAAEHTWAVRAACKRAGITVDAIGHSAGNATAHVESLLGGYDLVFAKGRSALEALASGAAVVLCDARGVGPMVTTAELPHLRRLNFGIRTLRDSVAVEPLLREIARYDRSDAQEVTQQIRTTAAASEAIDSLIDQYRSVIGEYREHPTSMCDELQAASRYLQWLARKRQQTETPSYVVLRSLYRRARTTPGVRALLHSAWAQRVMGAVQARWNVG